MTSNRLWLDWQYGTTGFILFGWWGILKAPWNEPLFSERCGHERFIKICGWRFKARKMRQSS